MSTSISYSTQYDAQRGLANINRALASIGYDQVPGPDLDKLPNITAPTAQEIADAVLKAKDPAADKAVAALQQRAWLADHGAVQQMTYQAWVDAHQAARDTLPGTLSRIQDDYNQAGATLANAAEGPLRAHEDLGALDLSLLPANAVQGAVDAVSAYIRTKTLLAAWRTIATAHSGQIMGQPAHWSQIAAPTPEQYATAIEARPQSFPSDNDAWSVARHGWKLDLAHNFAEGRQRRLDLREHHNSNLDTLRSMTSSGQHRAADQFAARLTRSA